MKLCLLQVFRMLALLEYSISLKKKGLFP
jgi:hypothetical protein